LDHHSWIECGRVLVPELVKGQLEGGIAMGIGHALLEEMPLYEGGPAEGDWNFNRYRLPRAKDVAVWSQTAEILPPLSPTDPAKGIAEVVMIPVVGAIANAVAHATGKRVRDLPITPARIKEALHG
ncbi:molybdopterin cofactor-binding domain-containing protein, partial [Pseudomonas aeruginosa]